MYDPVTGQQKLWEWNAASRTWGAFVQDTWKARRNLTVTLGFRYDDRGTRGRAATPPSSATSIPGAGAYDSEEQIANGVARPSDKALTRSPKAFNPACGRGVGRHRRRQVGRARRGGDIRELAHGGKCSGGVPRQPARASSCRPSSRDRLRRRSSSRARATRRPSDSNSRPLAGSALCPQAPCLDEKGGIRGAAFPIGGNQP